jgi:hypothetical protein
VGLDGQSVIVHPRYHYERINPRRRGILKDFSPGLLELLYEKKTSPDAVPFQLFGIALVAICVALQLIGIAFVASCIALQLIRIALVTSGIALQLIRIAFVAISIAFIKLL